MSDEKKIAYEMARVVLGKFWMNQVVRVAKVTLTRDDPATACLTMIPPQLKDYEEAAESIINLLCTAKQTQESKR